MLRYGFFDSEITGYDSEGMPIFDRAESSDFLAMFISQIISDGVLAAPGDCFQVIASEGMTLKVRPGFGIVRGRFAADTKEAEIVIHKAPETYKRIDRVVLRANYPQRLCEIIVKTGTADATPVPPELIRPVAGDYYELCLAEVAVNSNQTVIAQANITDTRYDSSVCGVVTQLIDHLDTSVFFAQLNSFYQEFVDKSNISYEQFVSMAQVAYNNMTSMMDECYEKLSRKGETLYEQYSTEIANYILQLKARGNEDLATLTQQLIDFRNINEAEFLEWFETIKGVFSTDAAGELLLKINELAEQVEFNRMMITTGQVLTQIATSKGDYLTDSMGNPILAGWPICKC